MTRNRVLPAFCLIFALALPARAHAQQPPPAVAPTVAPSRHPEHFTLRNGLEVVLEEDHRAPRVAVVVTYRVGQSDDPLGYRGLAHLVEHLMFAGFHMPDDGPDFMGQLEITGATDFNGFTRTDTTDYHEVVPADRLEMALWMESGRMAYLLAQLDAAVLGQERRVVQDEDRELAEAMVSPLLERSMAEALYPPGHPYRSLQYDGTDNVDAVTLPAVQWFFQRHYGPESAVLVLVGDFQAAEARTQVERYFGPIARSPLGTAVRDAAPPPLTVVGSTITAAQPVRLESLQALWPTPALFAPGDAELDMLAHVIAGRASSRLDHRLVDRGVAVSDDAVQVSQRLGSSFEITITAAPTHRARELLQGLDEVIDGLRTSPVSESELRAAKQHWRLAILTRTEGLLSRASDLGTFATYTGDPDYLARDLARYESATSETLLQTARTYLGPEHRVVGLLTSDSTAPREGHVVSTVRFRSAR